MDYVIALDVGGTTIKAGLLTRDGELAWRTRRPTGGEGGPDAAVATVAGLAGELIEEGGKRMGSAPAAVGVAVPGVVDEHAGVAVYSANLGWRDVPLRRLLAESTGLPVALTHDVRAGGVAEGRVGAGTASGSFLFLSIGTGIAGAIVLDGHAYPGAHGVGGEVGHLVVDPHGPMCACGARGCLEAMASAAAIGRRYAREAGHTGATAVDVVRARAGGDETAARVWEEAVTALATAITAVATMLDPEFVVLGGGLAEAGAELVEPLDEAVRARVTFQHPPRLTTAVLGDEAGCLGAGLLAWDLARSAAEGPHEPLEPSEP